MNKNKLYFGFVIILLSTLFSTVYAIENSNVVKTDSAILLKNTVTQNLIMQGQNGISPQNLVYDKNNKVFYVINISNNSLDIITYSNLDSLKFVNKIDLSSYGKTPVAVAFCNNILAVTIENEILVDSGKVVFFNEKGDFINALSVAPYVRSVAFEQNGKKVYISNFYTLGYKINIIDISKGIENITEANIKTLTYEKEKAADAFGIIDPSGFGMAMMAMSIVFSVLIFLYLTFRYIGKLSVRKVLSKQSKTEDTPKIQEDVSGEVSAAIAMALNLYQSQFHDEENAIITMEKVARTYSPWSSKIYGLRKTPNNK